MKSFQKIWVVGLLSLFFIGCSVPVNPFSNLPQPTELLPVPNQELLAIMASQPAPQEDEEEETFLFRLRIPMGDTHIELKW